VSTAKIEDVELNVIGRSGDETPRLGDGEAGERAVGKETYVGEEWRQWEGERERNGRGRIGGQRDNKEACGRAIGISNEAGMAVIGTGDGNDGGKGGG